MMSLVQETAVGLGWFDPARIILGEEHRRLQAERRRAERLAARLRELGEDVD